MHVCLTPFCGVGCSGRAKYCPDCVKKRAKLSKPENYFEQAKRSLEDVKDVDAPLRLDKVVDLAIRCAF